MADGVCRLERGISVPIDASEASEADAFDIDFTVTHGGIAHAVSVSGNWGGADFRACGGATLGCAALGGEALWNAFTPCLLMI